jgi:hypothetical protein
MSRPALPTARLPELNGSGRGPDVLGAGGRVRQQVEVRARLDAVESFQVAQARREATILLEDQFPPVRFVLATDEPFDVEAPDLAVAAREAQLRERDAHLRRPAVAVHGDLRVPDAVPRVVFGRVVVDGRVAERTGGGHLEPRAGQVIVVRIEIDDDVVGIETGCVAARQASPDLRRLRIEHPRPDIECLVVVHHADLCPLGRRLPFLRVGLGEAGRRRRLAPRGLVEAAVEHDRRRAAHGPDGGHRPAGRRRLRPGHRGQEQQETRHGGPGDTKTTRGHATDHPFEVS